ncbi:MAG: T9SS type A sorting domain-containing protein [Rubricoccaceae bacterium]|nr:T9SS type A sorting domain-containing protein [Rubricoccaceae bacterium]
MHRFATLLLLLLPAAALAQTTYTWVGGDGDWSGAANWSPNGVPGPGDTAHILFDDDYTVTLDVDAEVEGLVIGGDGATTQQLVAGTGRTLTLTGDGSVGPAGRLQLNNATLDGGGHLANGGRLDLWGSTANAAVTILDGAVLDVQRTSALNGPFANQGSCTLAGSWFAGNQAILTVAEGFTNEGVILLYGDHSGTVHGRATLAVTSGTLVNEGVLRASGDVDNAIEDNRHYLRAEVDNRGEIHARSRWLEVVSPGAQHVNRGRLTMDEDMAVLLSDGAFAFGPDTEIAGSGMVRVWDDADATFESGASVTSALDVRPFTPAVKVLGRLTPASLALITGSGTFALGLGGSPGSGDYGRIEAAGLAQIGYTLTLTLENGHVPQVGDVYTLVTGNPISGTFAPAVDTPDGLEVTLEQTASAVTATVTGVPVANEPVADPPAGVTLHAPSPNPASHQATVAFELARSGRVEVAVYDVLGREVAVLVDGVQPAGRHEAVLDAPGLPGGVYLVRLTTEAGGVTRRLTLLR